MKPFGILMVLPWELGRIGGVNAVVANLYNQFSFHGTLKPTLLIQSWEHTKPVFVQEDGYDKVRMRIRGPIEKGSILWPLAIYFFFLPHELNKIKRLFRNLRIAVINAHYPTLTMLNVILARRLKLVNARLVLSLHGTDISRAKSGHFIEKRLWRWLLLEADAIVTCSAGLSETVLAFEPKALSKTAVVHNGLDMDRFIAESETHPAFPQHLTNRRIILAVGAFDYNKGHDVLLNAFVGLAVKYADLHLVLIGQKAPDTANVESLIEHLGLTDRCTMLVDVPHQIVASYMRLASIFVLPTRSEAFGLVLLEAGAFGAPVVASRVGGIPEIISGPEYGVLVNPEDPKDLKSAMESLLEDTQKAREMGSNLRERVRKVFSWEEAYGKYRRVLEKIGVAFSDRLIGPMQ